MLERQVPVAGDERRRQSLLSILSPCLDGYQPGQGTRSNSTSHSDLLSSLPLRGSVSRRAKASYAEHCKPGERA